MTLVPGGFKLKRGCKGQEVGPKKTLNHNKLISSSHNAFCIERGKAIMHTIITRHCFAVQHSCSITPEDEVSQLGLQPGGH